MTIGESIGALLAERDNLAERLENCGQLATKLQAERDELRAENAALQARSTSLLAACELLLDRLESAEVPPDIAGWISEQNQKAMRLARTAIEGAK